MELDEAKQLFDSLATKSYCNTFINTTVFENSHFIILPAKCYDTLKNRFGVIAEIERKTIENVKNLMYEIEVRPKIIQVLYLDVIIFYQMEYVKDMLFKLQISAKDNLIGLRDKLIRCLKNKTQK